MFKLFLALSDITNHVNLVSGCLEVFDTQFDIHIYTMTMELLIWYAWLVDIARQQQVSLFPDATMLHLFWLSIH